MALRFYKNLKGTNLLSKGEFDVRFEIHDRDFSGTASEIPHMGSIPLSITWGNSGDRATEAIKKTSLKFSIVKEDGIDYSFFYTSDAKKYRVVVSSGQLNWQGYIAQDSYFEDLIYKGEIAITAIDNLSYLESSKFTLTGFQKVQDIIAHCVSDTGIDKAILYDDSFLTSNNTKFNLWQSDVSHLSDSSKLEALESILLSLGLRIEQTNTNWRVSSMYERRFPTKIVQSSWLGKLDTKELVPAKKEIRVIQSLNTPNFFDKFPNEDDYKEVSNTSSVALWNKFKRIDKQGWVNASGSINVVTGVGETTSSVNVSGLPLSEYGEGFSIICAHKSTALSGAPTATVAVSKVYNKGNYLELDVNTQVNGAMQGNDGTVKFSEYTPTNLQLNFVIKMNNGVSQRFLVNSGDGAIWRAEHGYYSLTLNNIVQSGSVKLQIYMPDLVIGSGNLNDLTISILPAFVWENKTSLFDYTKKWVTINALDVKNTYNDVEAFQSNILTATGKDRNVNEEIGTDFCMCPIASQSAFMQYRNAFYFSDFNPVLTVNSEHLITAIGKQFLIEQYDPMSRYSGNVYFNGYGAATPFNLRFNFHGEICEPNGVTLNVCKMQLSGEFTELKTYQSGDNLGYSITTKSSKSEGGKGTGGSGSGSGSGSADSGVISEILDELERRLLKAVFDENFSVSDALIEAMKDLKVNGSGVITNNLRVLGETTTYSLDGVEVSSSSISGTQYLWELADVADTVKDAAAGSMLVKSGSQWQHVETVSINCGNYKIV